MIVGKGCVKGLGAKSSLKIRKGLRQVQHEIPDNLYPIR